MAERPKQSLRKIKWLKKKNLKFVWYVKTLPLQKLLFEMNAAWLCTFPSPYVFDKHGKQIVEGDAIVYCQYIELFSYFSADTTMHPVLRNLGITDKVISFIMESVNGNKVNEKINKKSPNCFSKVLNRCVLNELRLKAKYSKTNLHVLPLMNVSSFICAHVSTCVASGCGENPLRRAW